MRVVVGTVEGMDTLELPVVDTAEIPAVAHAAGSARDRDRGRRGGPRARPPVVLRVFAALTGFGASLVAVALLLSDRAPGIVETAFGDRARRLWERIDASERAQFVTEGELPQTDFIVHVAIWTVLAALVGLAVWSWRGLVVAAVVVAAASGLLELAQGRYATTRVVEMRDMAANLLGVGLGVVLAALCYVVWSAFAALGRSLARR